MRGLRTLLWIAVLAASAGAAPLRVGRVNGLCVRALPGPTGYLYRGELLPVAAVPTDRPGRVELLPAAADRRVTQSVAAALGRLAAGDPVLAEAFARHGVLLWYRSDDLPVAGDSAGVALLVAAVSALTGRPARQDVAITGTLSETGAVLPVAQLHPKLLAALREGLAVVVMPSGNVDELSEDEPFDLWARLRVVAMDSVEPALFEALAPAADADRERYHAALAAYAAGDSTAGRRGLAACVAQRPDDRTAAYWLRRAWSPDEPDAVRAGLQTVFELAATGRSEAAAAALSGLQSRFVDPNRAALAVALVRQSRELARCREALEPAAAALAAGDFATAEERLMGIAAADLDPAGRRELAELRLEVGLAKQRHAAAERLDDPAAQLALAEAAEAAEAWPEVADALGRVGVEPAAVAQRRARALVRAGRLAEGSALLLAALLARPADDGLRLALAETGGDALAPRPVCSAEPGQTVDPSTRIGAGADEADATVILALDGRELARGRGNLMWRPGGRASARGAGELAVVVVDPAGNAAQLRRLVLLGPLAPAGRSAPTASAAGYDVHLVADGTWWVRPGDRLVIHPDRIFAPLLAAVGADPAALTVALDPPGAPTAAAAATLALDPAALPGDVTDLRLCGQFADGRGVGPATLRIVRARPLLAAIRQPAYGETLIRLTRFALTVQPGFEPLRATFVVDGEPRGFGEPGNLWLEPAKLSAGRHTVAVSLEDGAGRHAQTPPVRVEIGRAP